MNNIYVDELPDCCGNCSLCCKDDLGYWCQATRLVYIDERFVSEKRLNSCPLKILSTRLAEERKKVVSEIRETIFEYLKVNSMEDLQRLSLLESTLTYDVITDKLDQIERGE